MKEGQKRGGKGRSERRGAIPSPSKPPLRSATAKIEAAVKENHKMRATAVPRSDGRSFNETIRTSEGEEGTVRRNGGSKAAERDTSETICPEIESFGKKA